MLEQKLSIFHFPFFPEQIPVYRLQLFRYDRPPPISIYVALKCNFPLTLPETLTGGFLTKSIYLVRLGIDRKVLTPGQLSLILKPQNKLAYFQRVYFFKKMRLGYEDPSQQHEDN